MSREFRITNNIIEINDCSIEFIYLTKSAKIVEDRIIVLLEISYDIDGADNLYCLSKKGTIIWQSKIRCRLMRLLYIKEKLCLKMSIHCLNENDC